MKHWLLKSMFYDEMQSESSSRSICVMVQWLVGAVVRKQKVKKMNVDYVGLLQKQWSVKKKASLAEDHKSFFTS